MMSAVAVADEPTSWDPPTLARENTLEFFTVGPQEGEHWSRVWVVAVDDQLSVRLGRRAATRFEKNATAPFVKVRISGHEFDHVRAEPALEMAERVAADAAYLSLASQSGDRFTFEMLRKLCEQEDAAVGTLRNAPELVRDLVMARIGDPPALAELASHARLTIRQLRFALTRAGTSYQKLVRECRVEYFGERARNPDMRGRRRDRLPARLRGCRELLDGVQAMDGKITPRLSQGGDDGRPGAEHLRGLSVPAYLIACRPYLSAATFTDAIISTRRAGTTSFRVPTTS
jgi:hypothetical protein